jgi:glucose/arabinose dehydrogenase
VVGGSARAATQWLPPIPKNGTAVDLQPMVTGLVAPIDVQGIADGSGRLFITDQAGQIQEIKNGVLQSTPFLDVSSRLAPFRTAGTTGQITYDERGLLGFAVDPDFNNQGTAGFHKVYTYTSEPGSSGTADYGIPAGSPANSPVDHHEVLAEWTVDPNNPDRVDPTSRVELLRVASSNFNHDGGTIAFGPDKMLYMSLGDGGAANDVGNGHVVGVGNGQTTAAGNLLGKILRIDPHGTNSPNGKYGIPAGNPFVGDSTKAPEIFAYGLRNVYRFSFDRGGNHDLIAGDVGQNDIEEVDKITNGANFGWNTKEGTFLFSPANNGPTGNSPGSPAGLTDPLLEYDHTQGSAVVGGFVYRGTKMPDLVGKYIFADYASAIGAGGGRLFYADLTTGQITEFANYQSELPAGSYIKGLGEDQNGEIYVTTATALGPSGTSGEVFLIVPEPGAVALAAGALLLVRPRRKRMRG